MSHFTRIQTEIRDAACLRRALEDLGYVDLAEDALIADYRGNTLRADLAFPVGPGHRFGFLRRGETFELVGDFYGLRGRPLRLLHEITQRYAYHTVIEQTARHGFQLVSEQTLGDGSIRLVVEKWG